MTTKAITLMYHDIIASADDSGFRGADAALYKLSPDKFSSQLLSFSDKQLSPSLVGASLPDSVPLFITFDDGGKSAMDAADRLEEKGWRGHFFMTTEQIGKVGFLTKQDLVELHRRGHTVGSHSETHPLRMAHLSRDGIAAEWRISTGKLSDILGQKVLVASVPGGYYSKTVAECAEQSGIRYLFNSEPTARVKSVGGCLVYGRYSVKSTMPEDIVLAIALGRLLPRLKQLLVWNAIKPIKVLGGDVFLQFRSRYFNRAGSR